VLALSEQLLAQPILIAGFGPDDHPARAAATVTNVLRKRSVDLLCVGRLRRGVLRDDRARHRKGEKRKTLNNVQNLLAYYKEKGETAEIEVVAFGPGLHMLRQDTSPVKERVAAISTANPKVRFSACSNTLANMTKAEGGNTPPLLSEAKPVIAGVARIVELQKQGYIYIRP
jgi:intracellular sulfur oxidation DsrE/DsrF family protein